MPKEWEVDGRTHYWESYYKMVGGSKGTGWGLCGETFTILQFKDYEIVDGGECAEPIYFSNYCPGLNPALFYLHLVTKLKTAEKFAKELCAILKVYFHVPADNFVLKKVDDKFYCYLPVVIFEPIAQYMRSVISKRFCLMNCLPDYRVMKHCLPSFTEVVQCYKELCGIKVHSLLLKCRDAVCAKAIETFMPWITEYAVSDFGFSRSRGTVSSTENKRLKRSTYTLIHLNDEGTLVEVDAFGTAVCRGRSGEQTNVLRQFLYSTCLYIELSSGKVQLCGAAEKQLHRISNVDHWEENEKVNHAKRAPFPKVLIRGDIDSDAVPFFQALTGCSYLLKKADFTDYVVPDDHYMFSPRAWHLWQSIYTMKICRRVSVELYQKDMENRHLIGHNIIKKSGESLEITMNDVISRRCNGVSLVNDEGRFVPFSVDVHDRLIDQLLYIYCGPCGCGKTTFAMSVLHNSPRRVIYLSARKSQLLDVYNSFKLGSGQLGRVIREGQCLYTDENVTPQGNSSDVKYMFGTLHSLHKILTFLKFNGNNCDFTVLLDEVVTFETVDMCSGLITDKRTYEEDMALLYRYCPLMFMLDADYLPHVFFESYIGRCTHVPGNFRRVEINVACAGVDPVRQQERRLYNFQTKWEFLTSIGEYLYMHRDMKVAIYVAQKKDIPWMIDFLVNTMKAIELDCIYEYTADSTRLDINALLEARADIQLLLFTSVISVGTSINALNFGIGGVFVGETFLNTLMLRQALERVRLFPEAYVYVKRDRIQVESKKGRGIATQTYGDVKKGVKRFTEALTMSHSAVFAKANREGVKFAKRLFLSLSVLNGYTVFESKLSNPFPVDVVTTWERQKDAISLYNSSLARYNIGPNVGTPEEIKMAKRLYQLFDFPSDLEVCGAVTKMLLDPGLWSALYILRVLEIWTIYKKNLNAAEFKTNKALLMAKDNSVSVIMTGEPVHGMDYSVEQVAFKAFGLGTVLVRHMDKSVFTLSEFIPEVDDGLMSLVTTVTIQTFADNYDCDADLLCVSRFVKEDMSLKLLRPRDEEGVKAEDIGVQWDRYLSVFQHVKWGLGAVYSEEFRVLVNQRSVIADMLEEARKYREEHPIRPRKDQRILNKDGNNELLIEMVSPEEVVGDSLSDRVKRRKLDFDPAQVETMIESSDIYSADRREKIAKFNQKRDEQMKLVYEKHQAEGYLNRCRCKVCEKFCNNGGKYSMHI